MAVTSLCGAGAGVEAIKAAVVDEHEIFRRGIVGCLGDDPVVKIVADAASGPIVTAVDVAVTSLKVATEDSFECALVVCSGTPLSPDTVKGTNFISAVLPRRSVTAEQLSASVRAAAVGLQVSPVASTQVGWWQSDARYVEVLRLLAQGAGTQDIATSLSYSERTIKGLIQEIERELGARSRAHAVAEGIRRGLI
jgi:DNA-binding NarL/FixJ family response regulator